MKSDELRTLSTEELEIRLEENREELENLRFQQTLQQVENPLRIRHLKKEIAQILTVLREYELGIRTTEEQGKSAE
ncbi:MAG: 50S ribosomal protein L29 [Candidatus Marinimicrobia bacterium]|nr:50S ribosomal protein L29 [Candidatus Neomarinimicrobiota bacterium]MCF7827480.1 50S ribosomal protein L29 [Candidatus Neomarinimicrobiota bacterium]MCF7882390.1 50S ribosomal protein L29 [Candidatus Neomarinimicrobiota bacterium]